MVAGLQIAPVFNKTLDSEREKSGSCQPEPKLPENDAFFDHSGMQKYRRTSHYERSSDRDSISTNNHFHSFSSSTIQGFSNGVNTNDSDLAASIDLEDMAKGWHQQLQSLNIISPASKGKTMTCPPSNEPSEFRKPPQRRSALDLWPETLDTLNQVSALSKFEDQKVDSPATVRRYSLSLKDRLQADTWWMEPRECQESKDAIRLKTNGSGNMCSSATETLSSLNPINAAGGNLVIQYSSAEEKSNREFSSGIEEAMRAGFRKVVYRKQDSSSLQPLNSPGAVISRSSPSSESLGASEPATLSSLLTSKLGIKERNGASENDISENESHTISMSPEKAPSLRASSKNRQDELQDIDSIIQILVNIENQNKMEYDPTGKACSEETGDAVSPTVLEMIASTSRPSTPIVNAYAEVRAYISCAIECERPVRPNSINSSYQDATSQQENNAGDERPPNDLLLNVQGKKRAAVQALARKSIESMPKKNGTTLAENPLAIDTAPVQYRTWNGHANTKHALPGNTAPFNIELKDVFQSRDESHEAIHDNSKRHIPDKYE